MSASLPAASTVSPAPSTARPRPWLDRWAPWLLLLLAGATRLPLAGRSLGEPDCARYLIGMLQWLRRGPDAHFTYGKVLSPGYYAAATSMIRVFHLSPQSLLVGVSVAAAVITAPLLYILGSKLCPPPAAAAGAVLFLLAPGVWWLGLEAHPAAAALLLLLAALAAWLQWIARPRGLWAAAALACLLAALLLKADLILMAAVFPACAVRAPTPRRRPVALVGALGVGLALAGFFALRPALIGLTAAVAGQQTRSALAQFLVLPHGVEALKQVLPLLGFGLGTLALVAAGLGIGFFRPGAPARRWRARWGWLLAAWILPGGIAWLLIRGDNARHLAPLLLLPLWAALDALLLRRRDGTAVVAVLAATVLLNLLIVPPSSNNTIYPSGNVVSSVRDLAQRQRELETWLSSRPAAAACYLGNPTLPYIEYALLEHHPAAALAPGANGGQLGNAEFVEVNSPVEFRRAAAACRGQGRAPRSLEFSPRGVHQRFFGQEWHSLPLARHWYPGGTAPVTP